ncbi:hypothetical protein HK105_202200 [Polyrhizophydium stewartii]|uniref:Ankyrin repeat protein n=1 Tax=Polyrhizophydium stewartii TaxID=2732419 RepID=A0ABR4NFG0_9FUNG
MPRSIVHACVPMVRWMLNKAGTVPDLAMVQAAVDRGQTDVARLLVERNSSLATAAADRAAANDDIELVIWLCDHQPHAITQHALDAAARARKPRIGEYLVRVATWVEWSNARICSMTRSDEVDRILAAFEERRTWAGAAAAGRPLA